MFFSQDFSPFSFFLEQETIFFTALSCTHYTFYHACSRCSNHLLWWQTMSHLVSKSIRALTKLGCSQKFISNPTTEGPNEEVTPSKSGCNFGTFKLTSINQVS